MSTTLKEWLLTTIAELEEERDAVPGVVNEDAAMALAAMKLALASLEAKPIGAFHISDQQVGGTTDYIKDGEWPIDDGVIEVYAAPPVPVVPDEKTVPNPLKMYAVDAVAAIAEVRGWNAYRAAMLRGAEQQNRQQNIPENIPAMLFKPVSDLYGLTSPTGGETSFTFDAVEARDFMDCGWSCQEYVELKRFQEAVSGNSPLIQDGWVACSERMPEGMKDVHISNGYDVGQGWWDGDTWQTQHDYYSVPGEVTHWMPLPAAPQQEVK